MVHMVLSLSLCVWLRGNRDSGVSEAATEQDGRSVQLTPTLLPAAPPARLSSPLCPRLLLARLSLPGRLAACDHAAKVHVRLGRLGGQRL